MAVEIGRASPVMILAVDPLWAAILGLETIFLPSAGLHLSVDRRLQRGAGQAVTGRKATGHIGSPDVKVATATWLFALFISRPTFLAPVSSSSTNIVSRITLCTGTSISAISAFRRAMRSGGPSR